MKYKICFDTNSVFNRNGQFADVFNDTISKLKEFINQNSVPNSSQMIICIPEIVIEERVQRRIEEIYEAIEKANGIIKKLMSVNQKYREVRKRNKSFYQKILRENAKKYIKDINIEIVKAPRVRSSDLVKRAINKIKPFKDNTAGFKDTLIFLSLIQDAMNIQKSADRYIFCTEDKGFTDEVVKEFKQKTGKEMYLADNLSNVQELLDQLIPLRLKLKTRNQQIKNLISGKLGDVMVKINEVAKFVDRPNSYMPMHLINFGYEPYLHMNAYGLTNRDRKIAGYNFESFDILEIKEKQKDNYQISMSVQTDMRYAPEDDKNNFQNDLYRSVDFERFTGVKNLATFLVNIACDLNSESLDIMSVIKSSSEY